MKKLIPLFLAFLSIAALLIAPVVPSTNSSATKIGPSTQKLDATSEISAATASLQSGQGPSGIGPMSCSAGGIGSAYCETAQSAQAPSTSSVNGSWTDITPSSGPSSRELASMAYDAADGYVILFGGENRSGEAQCYDTGPNGQTYPVSNGGTYEWYGHQTVWDSVLGGGCRIENLGYPS